MLPQEKFKFKSSQMATQWLSATRTLVRLSEGTKVAFLIVFKSPPPHPSQPHPLHGPCYENGRLFHVKHIAITYLLRNRLGATCASLGKMFGGGTASTQEKWAKDSSSSSVKKFP